MKFKMNKALFISIFFVVSSISTLCYGDEAIDWTDPVTGKSFKYLGIMKWTQAHEACRAFGNFWVFPKEEQLTTLQHVEQRIFSSAELKEKLIIKEPQGKLSKQLWVSDISHPGNFTALRYAYQTSEMTGPVFKWVLSHGKEARGVICLYHPFEAESISD